MSKYLLIVLVHYSVAHGVYGQDESNKLETWYTFWGLGYPAITYPDELQELVDELDNLSGVRRTRVAIDFVGLYLPVNQHRTAVGFVINSAADRLERDGDWIQINQYIYGLSAMHFVQGRVGQGLFVRGDLGIAKGVVQNSEGDSEASENGFGFLVGGGYGVNVTPGTRILFHVNYARRQIEDEIYQVVGLSVGGLF